ncbi:MAG: hypothetical protein M3Q97_08450 [Bacteroidota bacterium]|nr:hypothetical protein [Bacteroidota bacterium]
MEAIVDHVTYETIGFVEKMECGCYAAWFDHPTEVLFRKKSSAIACLKREYNSRNAGMNSNREK